MGKVEEKQGEEKLERRHNERERREEGNGKVEGKQGEEKLERRDN